MSVEALHCTPAPACRLAEPPAMALNPPPPVPCPPLLCRPRLPAFQGRPPAVQQPRADVPHRRQGVCAGRRRGPLSSFLLCRAACAALFCAVLCWWMSARHGMGALLEGGRTACSWNKCEALHVARAGRAAFHQRHPRPHGLRGLCVVHPLRCKFFFVLLFHSCCLWLALSWV